MITILLSVVYIASIISRIVSNIRRQQRKKAAVRPVKVKSTVSEKNQYDNLMNSVEHPKQPAKKTLTSSRERNRK